MTENTVIFVTGANRGLGKGLLSTYLARPNITAIAGVRDPMQATSQSLTSLPKGTNSQLIIVKLDSTSETDAKDAVTALSTSYGIAKFDIVIANAGIAKYYGLALETPIQEVKDHFTVNTLGPLILFQATWALLEKSKNPKFVIITSGVGSIGIQEQIQFPVTAYGTSKAAVNFISKRIHIENPALTVFPIHPGWVDGEMGNAAAGYAGLEKAPDKFEDSIAGLVKMVDNATREETGGTMWEFRGSKLPW